MDNSSFLSSSAPDSFSASMNYVEVCRLPLQGATCDAYKVRMFGKLHFLKRPCTPHDIRLKEAFRKEFEIGFNLEHPGIVRYVAFDSNSHGIFTEWIEGQTLTRFIASNPSYFNETGNLDRFTSQLLDAVGYLHARSVVHLDLKPDNIMITDIDKSVKIIDLGFAVCDTYDTTPGCTADFAAPEVLDHSGRIDCRSDIYSIGKILEYIIDYADCNPGRRYRKYIGMCTADDADCRPQSIAQAQLLLRRRKPGKSLTIITILSATIIGLLVYNIAGTRIDKAADERIATAVAAQPDETPDTVSPLPASEAEEKPAPKIRKLTPAERLDKAEAEMGGFVKLRGHYDLKKEWYSRQYRKFDELRCKYLKTDTSQLLSDRLYFVIKGLINSEKEDVARMFPDADMSTVTVTANDILTVIIYLCYSDSRLSGCTDEMSHVYYDYARRKAALLQ